MGEEFRKEVRKKLEAELPEGVRYASNSGKRYEELTGYSHAALTANWASGGKLTACMGYVAHYCGWMGITPNLRRFDLDTYSFARLKGWVDVELYLGAAPSTTWLKGWWKVWDGNTYYYYFGNGGFVQYTKTPPAGSAPPTKPLSQGDYTLKSGSLIITWKPLGGLPTVETFSNASAGAQKMNGTSNQYSPLVATRL